MLTRDDCIALCELSEAEVAAIAEHEHIPEMIAIELGNYLCRAPDGGLRIERMIVDEIEHARATGDFAGMAKLVAVLRHFIDRHHTLA